MLYIVGLRKVAKFTLVHLIEKI